MDDYLIGAGIGLATVAMALWGYSLLAVAGRADDAMERMMAEWEAENVGE